MEMTATRAFTHKPTIYALFVGVVVFTPFQLSAKNILVFAAASTANALSAAIKAYPDKTNPIRVSYASSGALARQIENGAPATLFLSASSPWTKRLSQRNLLAANGTINLFKNRLVLAAPKSSKLKIKITKDFDLAAKLSNGRLAMGDPSHVPAGIYAKAALKNLGVWRSLSRKTARTPDVRGTLALIERDEVSVGIVYKSDIIASKHTKVLDTFPEQSHPPILYSLSIIKEHETKAARDIFNFLQSANASAIFRKFGFGVK
jgi:molybdate transport system substrate-binding protein